jgi:hypothetical protein
VNNLSGLHQLLHQQKILLFCFCDNKYLFCFSRSKSVQVFNCLFVSDLLLVIQLSRRERMGIAIALSSLTPAHFYACPKLGSGFTMSCVMIFFMFNDLR